MTDTHTSIFVSSKDEEAEYKRKREVLSREKYARDISTKVKIVKPTQLLSFRLLKEAEQLLLSEEANILEDISKKNLSCITLNNLGCFYKKLNYDRVALKHFMQVLALEKLLQVNTISIVSTMLNICANLSK
jgi:hypothetical protein